MLTINPVKKTVPLRLHEKISTTSNVRILEL